PRLFCCVTLCCSLHHGQGEAGEIGSSSVRLPCWSRTGRARPSPHKNVKPYDVRRCRDWRRNCRTVVGYAGRRKVSPVARGGAGKGGGRGAASDGPQQWGHSQWRLLQDGIPEGAALCGGSAGDGRVLLAVRNSP